MASGGIVRRQRKGGVRYEVVHELEPDPITGKRRAESRSFKTMADAQRYRRAHQVDLDRGLAVDRTEQTVAQ
ncbi:MAG TPA: hypothetical protein VNL71_18670, partial [Chloroflexota bacterium]|nr:hypothetical protein [Chloroflexota bacterium]